MKDLDELCLVKTSTEVGEHTDSTRYLQAATSTNTRRAYQSDIKQFLAFGGELPATAQHIEQYLQARAPHYHPSSLRRQLTAIRQWHILQELLDLTANPTIKKLMRGIERLHGRPKRKAAPFDLKALDQVRATLGDTNSPIAARDWALVLLGFFGAFRCSELAALQWQDLDFQPDGLIITLPRSKTDQGKQGTSVVIPFGAPDRCPLQALIAWRQLSGVNEGAVFRRVTCYGVVGKAGIGERQLNRTIQKVAKQANLVFADKVSSHSLRRGFATQAAKRGATLPAIQYHGRWKSVKTVVEYIETGRQFTDSAAKVLYDFD